MIKKTSICVQFEDEDRAWAGWRILGIRAFGRRARGQVATGAGHRLCSRSGYAVWVDFAKRISSGSGGMSPAGRASEVSSHLVRFQHWRQLAIAQDDSNPGLTLNSRIMRNL